MEHPASYTRRLALTALRLEVAVVLPSFLFSFGGVLLVSRLLSRLPSGLVVVSSGVGWRRFSVGRPGGPSSAPGSAPAVEALAFERRNNATSLSETPKC